MSTRIELLTEDLALRDAASPAATADLHRLEADVMAANQGLVVMVASRYATASRTPGTFDDLVQEGRIALLSALRRYRAEGGETFATFAMYDIRHRVLRWALEEVPSVRVSASTQRDIRRRSGLRDADRTGTRQPRAGARRGAREMPRVVSIDADPLHDAPRLEITDANAPSPADTLVAREASEVLAAALSALPVRERVLLVRRFGLDGRARQSQVSLAADLGVSRQRVWQLIERGLERLRAGSDIAALAPGSPGQLPHRGSGRVRQRGGLPSDGDTSPPASCVLVLAPSAGCGYASRSSPCGATMALFDEGCKPLIASWLRGTTLGSSPITSRLDILHVVMPGDRSAAPDGCGGWSRQRLD